MFNADGLITKRTLRGGAHVAFFESGLITLSRYLSIWDMDGSRQFFRVAGNVHSFPRSRAGNQMLLKLKHEYRLIDLTGGTVVKSCGVPAELAEWHNCYAVSACGQFIINGERNLVRVRAIDTGRIVWERALDRAELRSIQVIREGEYWALSISPIPQFNEPNRPSAIEVWKWPFGAHPSSVMERNYFDFGTSISNDGLVAFPGYAQKPVEVFDLKDCNKVMELTSPADNRDSGLPHWLSNGEIAVGWRDKLLLHTRDGTLTRTLNVPGYSEYSVDANDSLLALSYHEGFVLLPMDQLPNDERTIELSCPWTEPPEPERAPGGHDFEMPQPDASITLSSETVEGLRSELMQFQRSTWIPQVRFRAGGVTDSKMGGTPFIAKGEEWPSCGRCSQPMELFLQLNAKDLPAEMAGRFSGLLQVFLCVTNGYSNGTCAYGYEAFSDAAMLRLVDPQGEPRYAQVPFDDAFIEAVIESWERQTDVPSLRELEALGFELNDAQTRLVIDSSGLFAWPGEKLGGWPDWPQNVEYVACPDCGSQMDVLFQFDSGGTLPHTFMDGGTCWVSQCRTHKHKLAITWNS